MAEAKGSPDVARFETKEYDVTCCCERLCCGETKLILGPDEAELIGNCWGQLCTTKKRGPYGELGTVDKSTCLCFVTWVASSLTGNEDGGRCIGFGCNKAEVEAVVDDLKERQGMRGDRAKTRMGETTIASLNLLHSKVDKVMEKLGIENEAMDRDC